MTMCHYNDIGRRFRQSLNVDISITIKKTFVEIKNIHNDPLSIRHTNMSGPPRRYFSTQRFQKLPDRLCSDCEGSTR